MKKLFLLLMTGFIISSSFTNEGLQPGVSGSVEPVEAVNKVWAIKENDSVSVVPVNGRFSIPLKTGNWTIIVEAVNPYKNYSQSVLILEGGPTDIGVIKLIK